MDCEYTRGPWKLDRRSENLVGADGVHVRVYGSGLSFSGLPDDEARANARLIWEAPALLEALEDLLEAIPPQNNDQDWWPDELTRAVREAKKVINKAVTA